MRPYTIFILGAVSLFSCKKTKKDNWRSPFGEGTITITEYVIPATEKGEMDTTNHLFMRMRYFIKGNKILRHDPSSQTDLSTRNDSHSNTRGVVTTHLTAKLEHPTYLIKWDSLRAYTFFSQRGKIVASKDSLPNLTAELFLRSMLNAKELQAKISKTNLESDQKFLGKKCRKGVGTRANQSITFYYTDKELPVTSPLNSFFPSFDGDILALECKATTEDLKSTTAHVLFFVEQVTDESLPDYLFDIPKNVVIRDTVSWLEMYRERLH